MRKSTLRRLATTSVFILPAILAAASTVHAQERGDGTSDASVTQTVLDQIVVVASRRRSETDLETPVAISALPSEELAKRGITRLQEVSQVTPSLVIGNSVGPSGASIAIRGIGAATTDPGSEQAALVVIDGASFANANVLQFGQFDLGSVEVLRGPQALYFGKNATAGLIAINTANPTDELFVMARMGYNFKSRGLLTEAAISGPVTSTLGARLAFYRDDQEGFFRSANFEGLPDVFFGGTLPPPENDRTLEQTLTGVRGTLEFQPTDQFHILAKYGYSRRRGQSNYQMAQLYFCPAGEPVGVGNLPGVQDCVLDNVANANSFTQPSDQTPLISANPVDPVAGLVTLPLGNEGSFGRLDQHLATLRGTYDFDNGLTFDSLTSYLNQNQEDFGNNSQSPVTFLTVLGLQKKETFSQEIRLSSNWDDSRINFMIGGYYQDDTFDTAIPAIVPAALLGIPGITPPNPMGAVLPTLAYVRSSETFSGFGQIDVDITERIRLSAGGRYTSEKRKLRAEEFFTGTAALTSVPERTFNSFSPEVTLSYRPDDLTNFYISYRGGTKSGSFDTVPATPTIAGDISYDDERVDGVEGGVKSIVADGQLRFDLGAYYYKYKDLQLGIQDGFVVSTRNAGNATASGVELSANYKPNTAPGLTLFGSVNYNDTEISDNAVVLCYQGQSIAQGCNLDLNIATGQFTNQSVAGQQLPRAPKWSGSVNVNYERNITNSLVGNLFLGATYTDDLNPVSDLSPVARVGSVVLLDATVSVADKDGKWELALIANNLTDKLQIQNGFALAQLANTTTGTASGGPLGDFYGFPNNPRSFMLRLTFRPFGG